MSGRRGCAPVVIYPVCQPVHTPAPTYSPGPVYTSSPTVLPACVTPSPITPTEPVTTAERLLNHLRDEALRRQFPRGSYADLIPTIERETGITAAPLPEALNAQVHTTAEGIETVMSRLSPYVRMVNGYSGEFNRVVTFSVPANNANLSLRTYGVEAPSSPFTGPFWINDTFNPNNANSFRHHNRYEVHARREGDRIVYTVAFSHGFVGGMRITSGGQSFLLLSHTSPPSSQPSPTVAPVLVASPPPPALEENPSVDPSPPPITLLSADLPTPPTPSPTPTPAPLPPSTTVVSSPPPPPVLEDPPETVLAPPPPAASTDTAQANALPPPRAVIASSSPPPVRNTTLTAGISPPPLDPGDTSTTPPITSNQHATGAGSGADVALNPPTGQLPPTLAEPGDMGPPLPPALAERGDEGAVSPPRTNLLASLNRLIGNAEDLFGGLASSLNGLMPSGGLPIPDRLPPLPSAPSLTTNSGDSELSLPTTELASAAPPTNTSTTTPQLTGMLPPVSDRPLVASAYQPPRFPLAPYVAPVISAERAQQLSSLGLYSLNPLQDEHGSVSERVGGDYYNNIIDACYYLPQTAFNSLNMLAAGGQYAPLVRDTLRSFSDAIRGWNRRSLPGGDGLEETERQESNPRGSDLSVGERVDSILAYLTTNRVNPTSELGRNLTTIRLRLASTMRPLFLVESYTDALRIESAPPTTPGGPRRNPSPVAGYNPLVTRVQNTFETIFSPNTPLTTQMLTDFYRTVEQMNPNQIEFVHDFTPQDIIALRSMIRTARQTNNLEAFATAFAGSREAPMRASVLAFLQTPENRNVEALQAFLVRYFGSTNVAAQRDVLQRAIESLGESPDAAKLTEVAGQIVTPFRPQLQLTARDRERLPATLDRLERYVDRIQQLLRAQEVGDATDVATGSFLRIMPSSGVFQGGAERNPDNAVFEERLTAALLTIDQELALLQTEAFRGSAYATTRTQILLQRRELLREHLNHDDWAAYFQGTPARVALKRNLDVIRRIGALGTLPRAPELPTDRVEELEQTSAFIQMGIEFFTQGDFRSSLDRVLRLRIAQPAPR